MAAIPDGSPPRAVLLGVPKIGYTLHMCPFPGSLYACMQYLGDPCDYDYLMGVTGAAFRRLWQRDDGGNVDLMYLAPEPERRAFAALGYTYRVVPNSDRQAMLHAIKASITTGKPVLAFGIIGPPECGIITGYERDGAVLHGYSYFQDATLPGYYEQDEWFEQLSRGCPYGLILIGDRLARPSEHDTLADTLEWAIDLWRMPVRNNHASGQAAYAGWAAGMEVDADYPADNHEMLATRVMIHGDQTVMLGERRSAASYLRRMAIVAPEVSSELEAAAGCYDAVVACENQIWHWGESMGPEVGQALIDPALRHQIAASIRAAAAHEGRAVEHLEHALTALRVPASAI